jgi:hypothetical protein
MPHGKRDSVIRALGELLDQKIAENPDALRLWPLRRGHPVNSTECCRARRFVGENDHLSEFEAVVTPGNNRNATGETLIMEMNRGIWVVLAAVVLVAIGLFVSQSINGPAVPPAPPAPAASSPESGAKETAVASSAARAAHGISPSLSSGQALRA